MKDNESITDTTEEKLARIAMLLILIEYAKIYKNNAPLNSAEEGAEILQKEVDTLVAEVYKSHEMRDIKLMLKEATRVGAWSLRFMIDVCLRKEK